MQKNLNIKALGQSATIGSFYDGTTNEFASMSIFKSDITKFITTRDDPTTMYEFDSTNSYADKFKKFDINGNLKVKLMSGLVEIEGAGNYLKDEKTDSNSHKISLIYKCRTKKDSLNINDSHLVEHFALDNFHNFTHFVTSIKWGADVVVTFEQTLNENETNTSGSLSANVELLASLNIGGKLSLNCVNDEKKFDSNIKIKINADIPGLNTIPTNLKEMFQLFNDIPSKLKDCNNGKGKPTEYELTSLSVIKQMFKLDSIRLSHFYNDLDNDAIDQMVNEFDKYLVDKQKFIYFYEKTKFYKEFIKKDDFNNMEAKKKELIKKEMNFRKELFNKLVQIRKAQNSVEITDLTNDFEKSVDNFIVESKKIMEGDQRERLDNKFDFFKFLVNELNVQILDQKKKINNLLQMELRTIKQVFILVGKIDNRESEDWNDTYEIFTKMIDEVNKNNESGDKKINKQQIAFYFADLELHKSLIDKQFEGKDSIILFYKNGLKGYKGKVKYPNGDIYEGEMSIDGKFNGFGVKRFLNEKDEFFGDRYEGDWKEDKRNGHGSYYYADGSRYEGKWKNDKFNGQGIFYSANGDRFEGEFTDGEATGLGKFYSKDNNLDINQEFKDGRTVVNK